jgi:hypothetical protein
LGITGSYQQTCRDRLKDESADRLANSHNTPAIPLPHVNLYRIRARAVNR